MIKQAFYKSLPFWIVVVTNLAAVLVLIVSEDNISIVQAVSQAIISVITILGAANNPTNPDGFGANTIKE